LRSLACAGACLLELFLLTGLVPSVRADPVFLLRSCSCSLVLACLSLNVADASHDVQQERNGTRRLLTLCQTFATCLHARCLESCRAILSWSCLPLKLHSNRFGLFVIAFARVSQLIQMQKRPILSGEQAFQIKVCVLACFFCRNAFRVPPASRGISLGSDRQQCLLPRLGLLASCACCA
jgi:hypothetical protein